MREFFAKDMLIAVSAVNKETVLNTEQTLDTGMLCDLASIPILDRRLEDDSEQATGKEEVDTLYDLGGLSKIHMAFPMCQAQHMGFIGTYGLGSRTSAPAGTGGYKHTIIPIAGDLEAARSNPSFTMAARLGKHLQKQRFAGNVIDSFNLSMEKDSWVKLDAEIPGTGKSSTNAYKETKTAAYNVGSLTLAANGVAGTTPQERLDNVHHIRVQVPTTLEWVDVVYSVVSDATPAVITITPPGGVATSTIYEIIYNIAESGTYAWCSFPSRVVEPPLRVSDFAINIGGKWDGSALAGGHAMAAEVNSFKWTFNNRMKVEFTPGGGTYMYANRAIREGRVQTITFDRQFKDLIFSQRFSDLETFVFYAKAEGPEYDTGHKYTIELVFPKVGIRTRTPKRDGTRLAEESEFIVMQDDTYGSVILYIKNKVATYGA